jgi:outer membrane biosynthesis protein TonB
MKFSTVSVLTAIASSSVGNVSAFAPHTRLSVAQQRSSASLRMSLDDLESKLLTAPEPTKKGSKPAPKPAPVKKEKPAKKVEEKAAPVAAPAPAPAKKEKATKVKYVDLPTPPPAPKAAPVKVEKVKPAPKPKAERAPPAPRPERAAVVSTPGEKDPNAGTLGVALGAAPLLVAPVIALSAARGALSKTQARRAQIQKEIEEKEAARKAKLVANPDVDVGGVAGALVSYFCGQDKCLIGANLVVMGVI